MTERNELIADLLMGAALADRHLEGSELDTVKRLLCEAMSVMKLPARLERRIKQFDPRKLDVFATVDALGLDSDHDKRKLLELVAAVHESDQMWDFDEDAYLRKLANALRLPPEAYADLTVEVLSVEAIGKVLMPPPLPKG
jgi:uncharacterized membrane protein YebE (DUF533 family)